MSEPKDESSFISKEALQHYETIEEARRLERINSQIERVRTQELLQRYLPPPPAVILDVGGAAGAYAFWLAEMGYVVHLIDAVPHHIEQARPDELKQEIVEADFQLSAILAVEGVARLLKNFENQWQNASIRHQLLEIVRQLESEPHLLGMSTHIMAVGNRKSGVSIESPL